MTDKYNDTLCNDKWNGVAFFGDSIKQWKFAQ